MSFVPNHRGLLLLLMLLMLLSTMRCCRSVYDLDGNLSLRSLMNSIYNVRKTTFANSWADPVISHGHDYNNILSCLFLFYLIICTPIVYSYIAHTVLRCNTVKTAPQTYAEMSKCFHPDNRKFDVLKNINAFTWVLPIGE
jgi:hypothetical protein